MAVVCSFYSISGRIPRSTITKNEQGALTYDQQLSGSQLPTER